MYKCITVTMLYVRKSRQFLSKSSYLANSTVLITKLFTKPKYSNVIWLCTKYTQAFLDFGILRI